MKVGVAIGMVLNLALMAAQVAEASAQPAAPRQTFQVNEYVVRGNSVLDAERIEVIVDPYLGPDRTLDDVNAARDALQQAYRDAGYHSVVVDLPEQQVVGGVILLQVQETRIGRVNVEGARFHSTERILDAVPSLQVGKVPDFNQAQKELTALNQPDRQVVPLLQPGEVPGTVDLELKVDDRLPLHGSVSLNNDHSADTENLRMAATLSYDNLWQRGHSASLTFFGAPQNFDHAKVWSGSYTAPLPGTQWSVRLSGYSSDSNVSTLGGTSVLGNGYSIGLAAIRQLPTYGAWTHSLSLGIDYNSFEEEVRLGSDGATVPIKYSPLSASYNAYRVGEHDQTTFDLALKGGFRSLGWGSSWEEWDAKRYKAKSNFMTLQSELGSTWTFDNDVQLWGRVAGQLASGPLISNEQFAAGGMRTVRGYLSAEATGDWGYLGSMEVRTPSLSRYVGDWMSEWRFFAFAEGARLNLKEPLPEQASRFSLASVGLGTRFEILRYLSAELVWARALKDASHTESGKNRFHFNVRAGF